MSCYFANDGNGTFAVISIRDLMEMIEDWSNGGESFDGMDEDEWMQEYGDDYCVYSVDLVWHGRDRAVWDTSCLADPRASAGHMRYAITKWPLGQTWGNDVEWVDWRRYEGETAPVPSAEAVLRLIRMRKR